jgi:hypothetical protein
MIVAMRRIPLGAAIGTLVVLAGLRAEDRPGPKAVGVVSHIKVVSDKVEDVSSLDAWKASFIKPGMTDEEKMLAVWQTVVKFRHQESPPREFLQSEDSVQDPIKTFNVYGYGQCSCASSNILSLARFLGFQARGWGINAHSVPEVSLDGKHWHMLDASLICYFPKADGKLAGVEELVAGVQDWYAKNPDYRKDDGKLRKFMTGGGWRKGPEILNRAMSYDNNGWLPAATHGWYATMQEYDCKPFVYEYGYSQGYQVNVQLRRGESLTRNWSNRGLHVNMQDGGAPGCLKTAVGQGDLRYAPAHGDLAPGRIGNGTHVYEVPLAEGSFRAGALAVENLVTSKEVGAGPAVQVQNKDKPGVLILRMPSSYVYLGGELSFQAAVGAQGDMTVSFSDNHGLDWKVIGSVKASGAQRIDLKPYVFRRYDYRLKFVFNGAGTGLETLRIAHDIQHSQRALPALAQGKNQIAFSAGQAEGTITLEGSTNLQHKNKQLVYSDFHPKAEGLKDGPLTPTGAKGSLTFPVETPGDLKRLRFGGHYRARDALEGWDLQVSLDDGKTFRKVDRLAGPTPGHSKYVIFGEIPPGTRRALVRYEGSQRNATVLFGYRIDADYAEPHGSFWPIKVIYRWLEDGKEKAHVQVVRQAVEKYTIDCAAKPAMKSIALEWAE